MQTIEARTCDDMDVLVRMTPQRGGLLAVHDVDIGFAGPAAMPEVRRLAHEVFCRELGQHPLAHDGEFVDGAEPTNRYLRASIDGRVVGTMSISTTTPWSIAKRVPDGGLPDAGVAAEWRLLAVDPALRSSHVGFSMFFVAMLYCRAVGVRDILVSAIRPNDRMYAKLGFEPFAPVVCEPPVTIVPMRGRVSRIDVRMSRRLANWGRRVHWRCPALAVLRGVA